MIPCITDLRIPCRDELTGSAWNYILDKKDQGRGEGWKYRDFCPIIEI